MNELISPEKLEEHQEWREFVNRVLSDLPQDEIYTLELWERLC